MQKTIMITVVVALLVGTAAFFGGMQYQKSLRPAAGQFFQNGQGPVRRNGNGGFQNGQNRVTTRGEIINLGDNNLTVKTPDGSTRLVFLSGNTVVSESTTATKSALQTGQQTMVIGTANSDGSVTAQIVQLGNLPNFGPVQQ